MGMIRMFLIDARHPEAVSLFRAARYIAMVILRWFSNYHMLGRCGQGRSLVLLVLLLMKRWM